MTAPSDDLQAKRDRVAQLRDALATENAKRVEFEQARADAVDAAALDAEASRLERQVNAAQADNAALAVAATPGGSTADAKAAMQAAASGGSSSSGPAPAVQDSLTPLPAPDAETGKSKEGK